jgi:hypothetical protein
MLYVSIVFRACSQLVAASRTQPHAAARGSVGTRPLSRLSTHF